MIQKKSSRSLQQDIRYMRIALKMSERGKGFTEPNPLVGAVVVKNSRLVSAGFHSRFGGKHAEREALESIRERGTTLYVTLEPCCHFGKTPPCTDLLLERGVKRVVIALQDPNPLVNGKGIEALKRHGIPVSSGLCREWAADINRHYLTYMTQKRPYVAIHAGMSLDGKLSDRRGHSRWITSEELRRISHSLRGEFSAIMAGRGTVEADDPQLTIRESSWRGKRLFRVVLDADNSLSASRRIFEPQGLFPLIVFSSKEAENRKKKTSLHYFVGMENGLLSLREVCAHLHDLGISSVLVEGGSRLINSFLMSHLVDEFFLFVTPAIVGGQASAQLFPDGAESLAQAVGLARYRIIALDSGFLLQGVPACSPAS